MSDDLGFDFARAAPWFPHAKEKPYVLVRVSDEHAKSWADALGLTVRRCYVSDSIVTAKAKEHGVEKTAIIAARLPDAGATMAGDFGEILVYLYQGAKDVTSFGPKKWRLKQDRTKPAPHSDVLHFVLPTWPKASDKDVLLCSEVKTKSTNGASTPIQSAIEDSAKDRTSRLARTLVWLRERALVEPLGDVQLAHLERFINATDHPEATKQFRAVAVVCGSLVDEELKHAPKKAVGGQLIGALRRGDMQTLATIGASAAQRALEALHLGPDAWIPARLFEELTKRFLATNVRAVLPLRPEDADFWTPFVRSLLKRRPPSWEFFPSQIDAINRGLLVRNETFSLQMPTGAGKTALCETLLYWHAKTTRTDVAILLVPYRSLASELRNSVVKRLNDLGIRARCAYGGTVPTGDEVRDLDDTRVIVATPEALSGLLGAGGEFFRRVSLVICDEGHLLDGGGRGVGLELLLARMRAREGGAPRFVFVSAIVPNIEEINAWLGGSADGVVRSDYRPAIAEYAVLRANGTGANTRIALDMHPHAPTTQASFTASVQRVPGQLASAQRDPNARDGGTLDRNRSARVREPVPARRPEVLGVALRAPKPDSPSIRTCPGPFTESVRQARGLRSNEKAMKSPRKRAQSFCGWLAGAVRAVGTSEIRRRQRSSGLGSRDRRLPRKLRLCRGSRDCFHTSRKRIETCRCRECLTSAVGTGTR